MQFLVRTHLVYSTTQPCDVLLQIEAVLDEVQSCRAPQLTFDPVSTSHLVSGEEGIGIRRWVQAAPQFEFRTRDVRWRGYL